VVAQPPGAREEAFQRLGGILEPFDVGQEAVRFNSVDEPRRRLGLPVGKGFLCWETIERVVDFDGSKVPGVVTFGASLRRS
jgi:hypothetical protein